ncbi:MAG TPA: hypothetical protein VF618_11240 [Thermoanaerobaculia bacterium]
MHLRGILIGIVSVGAAVGAMVLCSIDQELWVLAPIPGLIGLMYHLLNLQPRFDNRIVIANLYRTFQSTFKERWAGAAPDISEDAAEDLTSHQPKFSATLWGAALLTSVLAIPAAVSGGGIDLAFTTKGNLSAPLNGLVYSGLGVYALIVLRTIGRVNAGALHARFLVTAALRATIAQTLGLFAGAANFFADVPSIGNTAYFLIGLFYPLFVEELRDKAIQLFKREKPVTRPMDVTMIDGIDDDVAELLTELGITDVQHVASSDPAVLTVRSLYPFERVVDWIDQGMLVRRFRERVAKLRDLNVRGITDWVPLMEPIVNDTAERADAEAVLSQIATAVEEPVESIRVFGRSAYRDYKTNLLWNLTQHRTAAIAPPVTAEQAALVRGVVSTMVPASAEVQASFDQASQQAMQRQGAAS